MGSNEGSAAGAPERPARMLWRPNAHLLHPSLNGGLVMRRYAMTHERIGSFAALLLFAACSLSFASNSAGVTSRSDAIVSADPASLHIASGPLAKMEQSIRAGDFK